MADFSKPWAEKISLNTYEVMPEIRGIPHEYDGRVFFEKLQTRWFFEGLSVDDLPPTKPGIDRAAAMRHLDIIQRSWDTKHEHKRAAVAYLMSLWFVSGLK